MLIPTVTGTFVWVLPSAPRTVTTCWPPTVFTARLGTRTAPSARFVTTAAVALMPTSSDGFEPLMQTVTAKLATPEICVPTRLSEQTLPTTVFVPSAAAVIVAAWPILRFAMSVSEAWPAIWSFERSMTSIWPVVLAELELALEPLGALTDWPTVRLTAVTVPSMGELSVGPVAWRVVTVCWAWATAALSAATWALVAGAIFWL
ncbi:MAG TPA: hypothetical protein VET90_02050 [Candidatus Binatus sp.]|nr:hypothetical protein [Candidatus Binatus sp.]